MKASVAELDWPDHAVLAQLQQGERVSPMLLHRLYRMNASVFSFQERHRRLHRLVARPEFRKVGHARWDYWGME